MPEITSPRLSDDRSEEQGTDPVTTRVHDTRDGLAALLHEAEEARRARAESTSEDGSAVCAWNHFENIPTFYNWNNRPR
ncbi:multiple cyclophane-containing RiPP AmcA [Paractinoplanes bogorensis]|uniref:multiple cyclophane-containing RiPP AmcA n=1 Tax=Paractinoplanes bogorensis TaxID=1610840 RepID=UPI001FECE9DF|nr:multiple cyclophane-containing RiPP AmcA [Actinoplanes bogorensis]